MNITNDQQKNKKMRTQLLCICILVIVLYVLYLYFPGKNIQNDNWLNNIEPDIDTVFLSRY